MTALQSFVQAGTPRALVLLPGAQMHPPHIVQAGLPAALAASGVPLDLHLPDLHLDPTASRDAVHELLEQVLAPLRPRYTALWLGGISLGGLLALRCAQRAPDGLSGLCLLAPYPGSRLTTNALERAGGLQAWQATPAQAQDVEFQLWQDARAGCPDLPAFIGWGQGDRFAASMAALAACLPRAHAAQAPHGHDWNAWLPLWRDFLAWLPEGER